jgi:hypothetical protein
MQQTYKDADRILKLTERTILDELIANINHIKNNFTWYEKFTNQEQLTAEAYDYFESIDYRNRMV